MRNIVILFLFSSHFAIAQSISGSVIDSKTKEPLENVTVYIQKGKSGAASNSSGQFKFTPNSKVNKRTIIQFSRIGYHTKKMTLAKFYKGENTILLSKKLEELDEVIVNSSEILNDEINFKKLAPLKSGVFAFDSELVSNQIYVIAGNSSFIEDPSKKALIQAGRMQMPTFEWYLREAGRDFSRESYSDLLQIYDIENNTWSISETKFRKRTNHNVNSYGNELYVLGGKRLSNIGRYEYLDEKIEVLKMGSNEVIIDHINPHQAANFASMTYNDNIIVMGGSIKKRKNGAKVYSDASHIYNITSGKWYELPKMKTAKETQGIIIDNKIYLIGGYDGSKLNTIESYDLKNGVWKNEGKLFTKMESPALTTHQHMIYIFDKDELLTYNTMTNVLEAYNIRLSLKSPKMHYHQNKLYLLGGYTFNEYSFIASPDVYVIDAGEFSKTAPLNSKTIN
ncbi:carboxypeptidase-like regulatory domain-containing protein [Winogradskyella flava]|uniref:carboxypeptidase-like regulatory domain-containing protein n=1 Tax=Winogradskyella flava TaxID=1884876 RepID=UPI0024909C53|nr:carboxypeptidase-like regulatory domain-containing protein [Winogradskyella flava]